MSASRLPDTYAQEAHECGGSALLGTPCDCDDRRIYAATDYLRERIKSFGGFQKPRSFWIDRDDVLRLLDDIEAAH